MPVDVMLSMADYEPWLRSMLALSASAGDAETGFEAGHDDELDRGLEGVEAKASSSSLAA